MKKLLFTALIFSASTLFLACNKNNGCPNNSEKAVIQDYTDSDSCDYIFRLEDGTKLEPTNRSEFPNINYEDGQLIWLKYKEASGASICGQGEIIEIKCISEREF